LAEPKPASDFFAVLSRRPFSLPAASVQRLVPAGFAEHLVPAEGSRVRSRLWVLGHAGLAHQRHRQALRVVDVVEAEAALDAQARMVGRAVAAVDADDLVVRTL
jgi:hypothetical protein